MGKGDNRRPSSIPKAEYDENFESIFGKKKLNIWEDKDEEARVWEDKDEEAREGTDKSISEQTGDGEAEA